MKVFLLPALLLATVLRRSGSTAETTGRVCADAAAGPAQPEGACAARSFGYDSVVCACDAAHCDEPPREPPGGLRPRQLLRVESSRAGLRLQRSVVDLDGASTPAPEDAGASASLRVSSAAQARQSILGFGGALTDAAALNILSLSPGTRRRLLQQLFGCDGARYSVVRVPVAGTDFSTRNYTYDDGDPDPQLNNFRLAREDTEWKIPLLKEIHSLVGKSLTLFASAWSAPDWMVIWDNSNNNHLNPDYYQTWADYYVRFLDAYAFEGLRFWGLTTQNEPSLGYILTLGINHLGWSPESMRVWIHDHLGPTLEKHGYGNLTIMIHDDQRSFLPDWPLRTLNDSLTSSYVSGIAVHWYFDTTSSPELLTETHNLFPDKFLLYTEASEVHLRSDDPSVELGNWMRAENYAQDIIQTINNWCTGWVDWNLALNTAGGPSYVDSNLDAAIIVNATADEFLKQPMLYALIHFSRYVPRGSRQRPVFVTAPKNAKLFAVAFFTPDSRYVLVILNRGSTKQEVTITLSDHQYIIYKDTLQEHSIITLVIRSK